MLTHKTLTVTLANGQTETVDVRALPLSKMEEFLGAVGDPYEVVKLTTPYADPDCLHAWSVLDIDEAAQELNNPLVDRLLKRTQATHGFLRPHMPATPSPSPSPTSSRSSSPPAAPQPGTKPSA